MVDKAGNASAWRPETIKVDHTKPTNTTAAPDSSWIALPTTRGRSPAATPTPACQRVEYSLDGGATAHPRTYRSPPRARTPSATRVIDVAGNASDWRTDTIGIDRTVPSRPSTWHHGWRNTQAACSVAASGGLSGLARYRATSSTGRRRRRVLRRPGGGRHHHQLPRRRRRRQRDAPRPTSRSTARRRRPPSRAQTVQARSTCFTERARRRGVRRREPEPGRSTARYPVSDRQRRHVQRRPRARSWSMPSDNAGNGDRSRPPVALRRSLGSGAPTRRIF